MLGFSTTYSKKCLCPLVNFQTICFSMDMEKERNYFLKKFQESLAQHFSITLLDNSVNTKRHLFKPIFFLQHLNRWTRAKSALLCKCLLLIITYYYFWPATVLSKSLTKITVSFRKLLQNSVLPVRRSEYISTNPIRWLVPTWKAICPKLNFERVTSFNKFC